jgi:hypothetical protein
MREDQRRVVATKAEAVRKHEASSQRPRKPVDAIDATLELGFDQAGSGRHEPGTQRKHRDNSFNGTSRAQAMSGACFDGVYRTLQSICAKHLFDAGNFGRVVQGCPSAVGVDATNVDCANICVAQGSLHRQCDAVPRGIGGRYVVGVTRKAKACNNPEYFPALPLRVG